MNKVVPNVGELPVRCPVCGGMSFLSSRVLWPELIQDWELTSYEVAYIDRQQGFTCASCKNNLRSMVLAKAILSFLGCKEKELLSTAARRFCYRNLKVLEINEAGLLTPFLKCFPRHKLITYPEADMTQLDFQDKEWDLVIHSETLEHVPDPVQGLRECRRILRPRGACIFTVPVIVGRMSRSREGLKASYHGDGSNPDDYRVETEFGADVWTYVFKAGFSSCKMIAMDFPSALAIQSFV